MMRCIIRRRETFKRIYGVPYIIYLLIWTASIADEQNTPNPHPPISQYLKTATLASNDTNILKMEHTTNSPRPKIKFRPSESGGVDGRMFLPMPNATLSTDILLGRLSLANFTNEPFLDDDPAEDWTRTTPEKDSWAHRERRRSSAWHSIDPYPSIKVREPSPPQASPPRSSHSPPRSRHGSILSLFTPAKDKNDRDVLFSGDGLPEDWTEAGMDRVPSNRRSPQERRGSILSEFKWGKDKEGRDVIHSGPSINDEK
jgi:hypothetical protein